MFSREEERTWGRREGSEEEGSWLSMRTASNRLSRVMVGGEEVWSWVVTIVFGMIEGEMMKRERARLESGMWGLEGEVIHSDPSMSGREGVPTPSSAIELRGDAETGRWS